MNLPTTKKCLEDINGSFMSYFSSYLQMLFIFLRILIITYLSYDLVIYNRPILNSSNWWIGVEVIILSTSRHSKVQFFSERNI